MPFSNPWSIDHNYVLPDMILGTSNSRWNGADCGCRTAPFVRASTPGRNLCGESPTDGIPTSQKTRKIGEAKRNPNTRKEGTSIQPTRRVSRSHARCGTPLGYAMLQTQPGRSARIRRQSRTFSKERQEKKVWTIVCPRIVVLVLVAMPVAATKTRKVLIRGYVTHVVSDSTFEIETIG